MSAAARVTVPIQSTSNLPPNLRSSINNALVSHNAIPAIQTALLNECQSSGFVTALRARVLELLRSGQCTSYGDIMATVMAELKANAIQDGSGPFVNGGTVMVGEEINGSGTVDSGQLKVPARVIEEGVKVVRGALEGCVDIVGEE